jgi:glycosyltransferase involved in cell wall biosynthesis
MNVLMVSDVYFPRVNGVSTSIQTFRRELAALGVRVGLVCPEYGSATVPQDDVWRVPARAVPRDPEDRLMRWRALSAALDGAAGEGWDLVHVQTPFLAHYAGLALARRRGIPCVATYHTLFEAYLHHYVPMAPRAATAALARRFSRGQCNALQAVIVPSTAMERTLRGYGVRAPLRVLPTGVPLPPAGQGDGARFRARMGVRADQPLLLFVGRVAFEKNIEFLLEALRIVRGTVPDTVLVIAGEGPALGSLAARARRLGLESAVRFTGYLDREAELPDCYRAADAFVFASRTETQGLVLLEAMALGIPVVALAAMGTRDILDPGLGCLAPRDDLEDFAAAVVRLLGDRELRARLSAEARRYAGGWSAGALAARMRDFYGEVLASGPVPAGNATQAAGRLCASRPAEP